MTKINSLNIRISGADLRVETVDTTPDFAGFAPWVESLTLAQWQTNTGLTALQYINAQDSKSVTLGIPDFADVVADKTSNNHDIDFDPASRLFNLTTTNGILAEVSNGFNSTVCASFTGNPVSNPMILAYCFQISRTPTATETLMSFGATASDVFRSLEITTSRYIQYSYKDNSGNTLTKTGSTVIPFDRKIMVFLFLERTKVRVFLHDGVSLDHDLEITNEGAFNVSSTLDIQAINCKSANGAISQERTSGYYFGHVLAEAVALNTFTIIEQTCGMFGVPYALTDVSTLDSGIVSLIQGPGAGNLATPKADVVDLVAGTVFTANGTLPTAGDGKFHKAIQLTNFTSAIFLKATTPAAWDLFGSSADFTLALRYKTGTLDASNRTILHLGDSTTQYWKLSHNNGPILFVVDASTKATSATSLASDTWYTIILKRASSVVTLQVNGETPVTASAPGTRSVVGQAFTLGGSWATSTTSQFLGRGLIDCIALYNRALTSDEIIQLRKGEAGRDGFFSYLSSDIYVDDGSSVVYEYRGPQIAATNNNALPLTGAVASGNGATYLSFKSPRSGILKAVDFWWKSKTYGVYAAGTGGTYTLSVRTDNAGIPSSTVVAQVTGITGFDRTTTEGNTTADFRSHILTPITGGGAITAGTQYHLCVLNTHASPSANYMSVNGSGTYSNSRSLNRPTMNNFTDFAMRLGNGYGGGAFNSYTSGVTTGNTPNITFHVDTDSSGTADFWFGSPWTDPISSNSGAPSFSGATRLRQRLPIASGDNFTITSVSVALTRTSASTGVSYRILASNGTTVLASGTISESNYAVGTTATDPSWGKAVLSSPLAITGGNTYYLEIWAASGTYYPSILNHQSPSYGSSAITGANGVRGGWYGGTNGILQVSSNSGSTYGTYSSGKRCLAFYFEVTVP